MEVGTAGGVSLKVVLVLFAGGVCDTEEDCRFLPSEGCHQRGFGFLLSRAARNLTIKAGVVEVEF